MNVSLTPELELFVSRKVESGMYQTASEVVREGLRLLQDREAVRELQFEELRREIAIGIDQADQGKVKPFTRELAEDVKSRGRQRRRQQGKQS